MNLHALPGLSPQPHWTHWRRRTMAATYTFDIFSSLDGYGSYGPGGDWGGYWGKQGPELLDRRLALHDQDQRMVFGANTFRQFVEMLASSTEESEVRDPWVSRMRNLPATIVSTTLEEPLDWPDATVVSGDAVDVVTRLKQESEVPLRSHGSLSLNRALLARRSGRPGPGDALPGAHRSDRDGPDLPGCSRPRPRADREPDARRPHPGAHLPAHPARTQELTGGFSPRPLPHRSRSRCPRGRGRSPCAPRCRRSRRGAARGRAR